MIGSEYLDVHILRLTDVVKRWRILFGWRRWIMDWVAEETVRYATFGIVVVGQLSAGGCGGRFDPRAPAIERLRLDKERQLHTVVDSVTRGLPITGTGQADVCEAGQDNLEVYDTYRWRCFGDYVVIAGLTASDPTQAVSAAQDAAAHAGCTEKQGIEKDHEGIAGLKDNLHLGSTGPLGGYDCKGIEIRIRIRLSDDERSISEIAGRYTGSYDLTVTPNHLDAIQAIGHAHQAGHRFVLAVEADGEYYRDQR
jgi:hypothetical protein